jgi:predicted nucleic acid-binding protein
MKVLVDTAIWIDHIHQADGELSGLLQRNAVVMHPYIIGEILLGSIKNRDAVGKALKGLQPVAIAQADEVLEFIERNRLFGAGIGYVDVHLLASAKLTHGAKLWTRDRRLSEAATRLDINHSPMQ